MISFDNLTDEQKLAAEMIIKSFSPELLTNVYNMIKLSEVVKKQNKVAPIDKYPIRNSVMINISYLVERMEPIQLRLHSVNCE